MNIKDLQNEVAKLGDTKKRSLPLKTREESEILYWTVKLNEEVGELCNDILSILQLQRASKLERFEKKNFYQEFADVIITLLHLAKHTNVDVERAVKEKLKTIKDRYLKRSS
ncbi:hypothetical protein A3A93_05045 [Candidatus Roizmanbacteria bacterium RIFCSPLOWO2_01_FULL_38_12]|uniref:NTP pyrophosphohydrolase MazG putative catalytic core domain-containing protein n=1 Tax=Candidatus Roizmanbacteria bacterium RIFCSPLOWO2_01_FULL_38_12 TaxID=1802061 RepID=A0A1F7IX37_9BACT|nr:MAG: hypothetical protein A3F59_05025 [Candidatus Roizmanbacteria bacterium RIFCSPHIGHO2_12_FULL_38_13]OGK47926.1 MAG: hypothetical protein A3A93_05045 [Candidatus Roizmanbacteria bacterium RIFCSPLOWO2_01_FULL_38_12]